MVEAIKQKVENLTIKYIDLVERRIDDTTEIKEEDLRDIYDGMQMISHIVATLERLSRMENFPGRRLFSREKRQYENVGQLQEGGEKVDEKTKALANDIIEQCQKQGLSFKQMDGNVKKFVSLVRNGSFLVRIQI